MKITRRVETSFRAPKDLVVAGLCSVGVHGAMESATKYHEVNELKLTAIHPRTKTEFSVVLDREDLELIFKTMGVAL